MPFFNVKDGELNKIPGIDIVSAQEIAWLTDRLILHDDILPEKLMVIGHGLQALPLENHEVRDVIASDNSDGDRRNDNSIDNSNTLFNDENSGSYLLALDKNAALVVLLVLEKEPASSDVDWICELSWEMRYLEYSELELLAADHFANFGVESKNLAQLHARYFDIKREIAFRHFNETQRATILAPGFGPTAFDAISWRRIETNLSAYSFNLIDVENSERILVIQSILKGGPLSSFMSAIGGIPAALRRKIARK